MPHSNDKEECQLEIDFYAKEIEIGQIEVARAIQHVFKEDTDLKDNDASDIVESVAKAIKERAAEQTEEEEPCICEEVKIEDKLRKVMK